MASILISMPDGSEFEYVLGPETVRVGRDAENEIPLQDDSVSTFHSEIRYQDGNYVVHDLGSTNGLRVNGERVSEAALSDGDLVRFGNIRAKFVGDQAAAPVAASGAASAPAPDRQVSASIGAIPAGMRPLGFGPKAKEKDAEKSGLIGATVLAIVVCLAAIFMSFTMSAG